MARYLQQISSQLALWTYAIYQVNEKGLPGLHSLHISEEKKTVI